MNLVSMFIAAVLINNIVLSKFLGMCPFLGVSKKMSSALGMGVAVIFVIFGASVISYGLYYLILEPLGLQYMQLITFILVIASFVQFVEMFIKKFSPALYKSLGVYLPLITTNCAVLYVAQQNISSGYNFIETCINSIAVSDPICSYKVPPKSLVMLYFPSEKAPAPPKPLIIEQVSHFIHDFIFFPSIGHALLSKAFPFSIIAIFKFLFLFTNS